MSETILMIGGGLGGLFTGALLAKEGYSVTVLEKNHTIGGGLQTFMHRGHVFETGMHILGGFRQGGALNRICSYLGIMDKLSIRDMDDDCMDSITYLSDGKTYRMAMGKDHFIDALAKEFPAERENLQAYVDTLYRIADEVDIFYLRHGSVNIFRHSSDFMLPADVLIARYISDPKLKDVLAYMNPMYGGMAGHTPAYIHALINVLYIDGACRFNGGSQQLADALADVIRSHGGSVLADQKVEKIDVDNREISKVTTGSGDVFTADHYISSTHPCALLQTMDEGALPKAYRNRLNEIPNSYSAFTVYITFKKDAFPYLNRTCYFQDDYGLVWQHGEYDENTWPRGFMFFTPSEVEQGKYATKMIINSIMDFNVVRRWENTTVGHRGADYLDWKRRHTEKVLDKMEQLYPSFRDDIDDVFASSPLTIRDYYNEKEGSLYGFRKDCQDIALSQVPIYTKIKNLLLTGQNINLHGICGVPLTAINTVEALIGENKLIDKL